MKDFWHWVKNLNFSHFGQWASLTEIFIDRGASRSWEIIRLVASVRLSVCPSADALTQQKHHDTWNTVKDLCVFVSNQGAFTIKDLRAAVEGF